MSRTDDEQPSVSDWAELRRIKEFDLGKQPLTNEERGKLRLMLKEQENKKWLWTKIKTSTAWLAGLLTTTVAAWQLLQGMFRK
jgi:hypothetical protein